MTTLYTNLVTTNGAVTLMRSDHPGLPPYAVFLATGVMLDTFTDENDAKEFAEDAMQRARNHAPCPNPDAPCCSHIRPTLSATWTTAKANI